MSDAGYIGELTDMNPNTDYTLPEGDATPLTAQQIAYIGQRIDTTWNPGLENADLIRWGRQNTSDWTVLERYGKSVMAHSGAVALRVSQSANRRTFAAVDAQAEATVEGQAVAYGTTPATGWTGVPCEEGDEITASVWVRAFNGAATGGRVWLLPVTTFESGLVSDPVTLVDAAVWYQPTLTWTADSQSAQDGEGIYIFFEGDSGDYYLIDDVEFVVAGVTVVG